MLKHVLLVCLVTTLVLFMSPAGSWAIFEDLEPSPRARAMGGAVHAMASDCYAVYHNPAGLTALEKWQVGGSFMEPYGLSFLRQDVVCAAIPLGGRWGGLGVGLRHYGVTYEGVDLQTEYTLSLGHGFRLLEDYISMVSFGYVLNIYNLEFGQTLGHSSGTDTIPPIDPGGARTLGLDLAARVSLARRTYAGVLVKNVNNPTMGKVDQEDLRRQVIGGILYEPYPGVSTSFIANSVLGERTQFRAGAEAHITSHLAVRVGVQTEPSVIMGGFGLKYSMFSFHYAYSTGGGVLDGTSHFGLSVTGRP